MTIKHVLGLSGGKDSTCLALAMRERHPEIEMEYICTPTGNELPELFEHLDNLEILLGKPIKRLGINEVWGYLNDRSIPIPKRTDCGCCYHQRIVEWRDFWRDHSELFWQAAGVELAIGHTFRSPGRDTWPVRLIDLAKEFERGRPIRGRGTGVKAESCRVCSL